MLRDGTVERIADDIRRTLAAGLGPGGASGSLAGPIERAVWLCMLDAPHGGQVEGDPALRLAQRIRHAIELLLEDERLSLNLLERLGADVERAVLKNVLGDARRADVHFDAGNET